MKHETNMLIYVYVCVHEYLPECVTLIDCVVSEKTLLVQILLTGTHHQRNDLFFCHA